MIRTSEEKKNKQFEGCLAEVAVAKFLVNLFEESSNNVHVYDAERRDFKYRPGEEYDVMVSRNGISKKCEVRSSWSYKTTLTEFCDIYHNHNGYFDPNGYGDVIGTYTHEAKKSEELADFYFRPVLQLNELQNSIPKNSIELIKSKKVKLYIVAACSKEQMLSIGSFNQRMSKDETKYHTSKIKSLDSVDSFKKIYNNLFKE